MIAVGSQECREMITPILQVCLLGLGAYQASLIPDPSCSNPASLNVGEMEMLNKVPQLPSTAMLSCLSCDDEVVQRHNLREDGGGGDHSFDAQGWVEVADQRHQRDMQSESSGMDELDTSGQLTSTCKPNPSTGWDVTLNRHQLDYLCMQTSMGTIWGIATLFSR
ncbi:hypothetical protein EMCRGX_G028672 [Ephydatia muelleri]